MLQWLPRNSISHPAYFTPNPEVLHYLGINKEDKYAIVRFVSWDATHDRGRKGFSEQDKIHLVKLLDKYYKVFISSEKELPVELDQFRIGVPFEKMHDVLYYAAIYVGEGATMASEAGILGTPAIYVSTISRCYNDDQEKYGTVYNSSDFQDGEEKDYRNSTK